MSRLSEFRAGLSAFRRDDGGAVLIYVTLIILALIALLSLAIDGARVLYLNGNLQEIADAAALAGAKELDGRADAIQRATEKAVSYLQNHPEWSDDAHEGVEIIASGPNGPKFFQSFESDQKNVPTTSSRNAAFIKVTTYNRAVSFSFGKTLLPGRNVSTNATAVARSAFAACADMQSFLCNPWESQQDPRTTGGAQKWQDTVQPGWMFYLAGGAGGAAGNWGLIDPPGGSGHNPHDQASFWAQVAPDTCSLKNASEITNKVDPGNSASKASAGMNVRFDNPRSGMNSTSAPIVIDGFAKEAGGNACRNSKLATAPDLATGKSFAQTDTNWQAYQSYCNSTSPQLGSCPLPRDRGLTPVNSANPDITRRGAGADPGDLDSYWRNHHAGTRPPELNTRYKIYACETDPANPKKCFNASGDFTSNSVGKEHPNPQCKDSITGTASRRLIKVAIVDCDYWGITGGSTDLPITTLMAEFFMTEPAVTSETPSLDGRIYGELVRTYTVNSEGSGLYHIVQLVQ